MIREPLPIPAPHLVAFDLSELAQFAATAPIVRPHPFMMSHDSIAIGYHFLSKNLIKKHLLIECLLPLPMARYRFNPPFLYQGSQ